MKNKISLEKIAVSNNRVDFFFSTSKELSKYFKYKHLYFKYNYDLNDVPTSVVVIPFVANIIPLVWLTDSILEINEVDESFFKCLAKVKVGYKNMFPNVQFKGEIRTSNIIPNQYTPTNEAASLFSGGLDALATFVRIKDKRPILITEFGWHEKDIQYSEVWEADKKNAMNFASENGLQNILVESNYGTFIDDSNINKEFSRKLGDTWWHGLHHGLAIISAAVPICYKLKIKTIYIGSSNTPLLKVPCASDPSVDNEFKFASSHVFHDAYELNRQDKVKVVVDQYSSIKSKVAIRVCFKNEENCCRCEKCLRTIMGIVAEGENPIKYGFNIPGDLNLFLKQAIDSEVKFFTDTFIKIYWELIQDRMKKNYRKNPEIAAWFIHYQFKEQRKKSLLKYRIVNFFPILKRKIHTAFSG
ncbi:peptidase [Fictibacillus enclensis]|uniref:peptidase n=1 Tax=Fictibacillus enclensis TaxID=1017270 RepID=UPI0024BF553D|nr:peptidase [Fictibacillus enclensis]WHY71037.1 peptidase [Fictibacillus enclensis]